MSLLVLDDIVLQSTLKAQMFVGIKQVLDDVFAWRLRDETVARGEAVFRGAEAEVFW